METAKSTQKVSAEQVRAEVHRYWSVFANKDSEQLADYYAAEASVFSSVSSRPEPGRLAAARRQREYFHAKAALRASVGMIDVVLLSDNAAVASYTFQFHAIRNTGTASQSEENITNGRASQVFIIDLDGKLRIVHEHLSALDKH